MFFDRRRSRTPGTTAKARVTTMISHAQAGGTSDMPKHHRARRASSHDPDNSPR